MNNFVINDWLVVIDDVLTPNQCHSIITNSQSHLKQSSVLGEDISGYRTSYDFFHAKDSAENQLIEKLTCSLIGMEASQQEDLLVIRYGENQQYKEHYDFVFQIEDQLKRGGDRIFSLIFYLNNNFTGGETYFPKLDIAIEPKIGRAVIWKNYINNQPNYESLHCGLPVKQGEKWIATKWIRELAFQ